MSSRDAPREQRALARRLRFDLDDLNGFSTRVQPRGQGRTMKNPPHTLGGGEICPEQS